MPAGARFIVTFSCRSWMPELRMAVRTRSFDSRTAVSGSPTMSKAGSPAAESTSTAMMRPSTPIVVPPNDLANNRSPSNPFFLISFLT